MKLLPLLVFLLACSQTATLTIDDAGTIPVDNSVDSGELEDTAG